MRLRSSRPATVVLLVLPCLTAMAVPLYARAEPRLAGVPFFYWYQFGCLIVTVLCLSVALWLHRETS
ncbi:DUF3311 domain-containing protein [Lentzea rhizosphaerae]|uniref:DUF3311 domain-containing protein n=1 Tax=Lentzea rhizosphaerae TaxID=2041025 RepID=A0ABV8BIK5_9PSEU